MFNVGDNRELVAGCRSRRVIAVLQRGSICGSDVGPIRVLTSSFPLFCVSLKSSKLFILLHLPVWGG